MDPINNINQIMQVLRQRLAERTYQKSKTSSINKTNKSAEKLSDRAPIEQVMQNISKRISALGPEHQRSPAAVKIFVESVLTWEFGEELLEDNDFDNLINDVQKTILDSPDAQKKLFNLFDEL